MARENRATFLARLRSAGFEEHDVHLIHNAYIVAKDEFRSMSRKERDEHGKAVRYFEHLRAVAILLIEMGCRDPQEVIAGILHDGPEDTREITVPFIAACYGVRAAQRANQVSKLPKEGYLERLLQFGTWETFRLKGCDRLHNLRTLHHGSLEFRRKQIAETEHEYYPVFDRMVAECPPTERSNMERLRSAIHAELARQCALLPA